MSTIGACPGCGVRLPSEEGPTHRYMTASPACWAAFGRVIAAEYRDPARWQAHAFTVDAYAVQHPGDGSPAAVRSLGVHLITLHFTLERDMEPALMARVRKGAAERLGQGITRLEPPVRPVAVDVTHLLAEPGYQRPLHDPAEHRARARAWARSAWHSWAPHHDTVAGWADWLIAASPPGFPHGGVRR